MTGLRRALHLEHTAVRKAMGTLTTILLVSFAWIFFYTRSVPDAVLLIRNLVRFGSGTDIYAPWASLSNTPVVEMALAWGLIGLMVLADLDRDGRTASDIPYDQQDRHSLGSLSVPGIGHHEPGR